jgi:drug/metabolite transporter (DMT)-like permease
MTMGIILGLIAAILYGSSDFAGGLASRRIPSLTVNVIGGAAATAAIWVALLVTHEPMPAAGAVIWGLIGGIGNSLGCMALYRGMGRGQMSVVGPVSAVGAAVVPVVAGLAMGERPGLLAVLGMAVALPAIALVASTGDKFTLRGNGSSGLMDGLAAGAAFGVLFVAMAKAGQHSGLWPVAVETTSSLALFAAMKLRSGHARGHQDHAHSYARTPMHHLAMPVFAGLSGVAATLTFFFSSHLAMLSTAAVLVSLYPGVTVMLARLLLHERFNGIQRLGIGLCAFAVIAVAVH